MTVNTAKFEESTEIVVDTEVEIADVGWTLTYCSVNRVGNLVVIHLEASFAAAAAAAVATLQSDFCPGDTVKNGDFELTAEGALTYTGSTTAAGTAVCQLAYQAGTVSP